MSVLYQGAFLLKENGEGPFNFDDLIKSQKAGLSVNPAKAGIRLFQDVLDSAFAPVTTPEIFAGSSIFEVGNQKNEVKGPGFNYSFISLSGRFLP